MSPQLQAALIAGAVALLTASLTGWLSWQQIRRERKAWLYDIKASFSSKLYEKRMEEYAELSKLLMVLSSTTSKQLTVAKGHQTAGAINEWMYGAGGLLASADTRNAGWALRDRLLRWKSGRMPADVMEVRKLLFWSMRHDLDISSGRSLDETQDSVIKQLEDEMNKVEAQ